MLLAAIKLFSSFLSIAVVLSQWPHMVASSIGCMKEVFPLIVSKLTVLCMKSCFDFIVYDRVKRRIWSDFTVPYLIVTILILFPLMFLLLGLIHSKPKFLVICKSCHTFNSLYFLSMNLSHVCFGHINADENTPLFLVMSVFLNFVSLSVLFYSQTFYLLLLFIDIW